jgi:hypothetical protein
MRMQNIGVEIANGLEQLPIGTQEIQKIAVRLFNLVKLYPGISENLQEIPAGAAIPHRMPHPRLRAGEINRNIHMSIGLPAMIQKMHDSHRARLP